MVVDTSALIAIMLNEPERQRFNELIHKAPIAYITAANLLETRIVLLNRRGERAVWELDGFVHGSGLRVIEVSRLIADIAFDAYRRFGKGSGHGAGLNFGDCFAYALAKHLDEPLLFKGDDFFKTDITPAFRDG